MDPFHKNLANTTSTSYRTTAHNPTLVVEVGQDNRNTHAILTNYVLGWHLDIIEHDKGRAC